MTNLTYSTSAEEALLGSVLGGSSQIYMEVLDTGLVIDDFWGSFHQRVWRAITEILATRTEVDAFLVTQHISDTAGLQVDEVERIWAFRDKVASVLNGAHYAEIVHRLGCQRRAAKVAKEIDAVLGGDPPPGVEPITSPKGLESYLSNAAARLLDTVDTGQDAALEDGKELAGAVWADFVAASHGEIDESTAAHETGFQDLDDVIEGLDRDDTLLIAGATSMGKTAFAQDLVYNLALSGLHVRWQSFEMPSKSLMRRFMASAARVPLAKLKPLRKNDSRAATLEQESSRLVAEIKKGAFGRLTIDDRKVPMSTVRMRAKRQQMTGQLDVLVVDHLHISMPEPHMTGRENRERQLADAGERLKAIGMELGIPVIGLVQFNREVNKRAGQAKTKGGKVDPDAFRPRITDIAHASALEQIATKILMVHRPAYYEPTWEPFTPGHDAEIIIGKSRDSGRGSSVWLRWEEEFARFSCPKKTDITRFHAMGEAADALAHY